MAKRLELFLFALLFLSRLVLSQSDEFLYAGFKDVGNNITLNGAAEIEHEGIIKLTNDTQKLLGHAFQSDAVLFKNPKTGKVFSFSTAFAFAILPQYHSANLGGHGMAFVISSTKELKGALSRQYLGLVNSIDNGNISNHLFAVEFDTVQDIEFKDINDNHVGIDINSVISNASVPAGYFADANSTVSDLNLKSGSRILAWIDYDSRKNQLNVTLSLSSSKPSNSLLSFDVDLSPFFEDYMYVGFSASTGLLAAAHYVIGWSFKINGHCRSLDLNSLPTLPVPQRNHVGLTLGASLSAAVFVVFAVVIALYVFKRIKNMDVVEDWEHSVGPHRFSYKELKQATRGFRDKQLLGFGGFGRVYKGTLPNSDTQVAVKRINHESKQGLREFISEIASIGRLRHRNLVPLLGWCRRRGDLLLVYEFMPNGSLDKHLFYEPEMILTWEQRFKIIKGVASGLLYLHEGWEQTVIHRDIKAANVLLDSDLNGRLGDFGLAKLYEHGSNPSTTRVVGTLGYLAPELTKTGKPTTSSDVFAFGAFLLEVVCGRRPIEPKALPEELTLADWVWDTWKQGAILEVVDPRLGGHYDEIEAVVVLKLGVMCSSNASDRRPSMRQVVRYLESEAVVPEIVAAPDEYDAKKGDDHIGEFDDFLHSYPTSSYLEKVSAWSAADCADADAGLEAGSRSLIPIASKEV